MIRPIYSSPPLHGALLVNKILSNPEHFRKWNEEMSDISKRLNSLRKELKEKLIEFKAQGNWNHIVNQNGMYSFTGLNRKYLIFLIRIIVLKFYF